MEGGPTPRQMAKGVLNGIVQPRPLFLPIVFSLGAKVENVPLGSFLGNPTKISSSLRQMRMHLRADGVACYFDPYLEVEALGAKLQRISDHQAPTIHWPDSVRMGELPEGLRSPEEAPHSGRVPVAVEVIRRMNALPNREFLLMAGVTGPLTLAAQLTELEVATQMATTFLEAGADTIIIQEEIVPALSMEDYDAWAKLLVPTINVIRFYEALPLLHLSCDRFARENWELICRQHWDCVMCAPADVLASLRRDGSPAIAGVPFGIALPLDAFQPAAEYDNSSSQDIQTWISYLRPSTITTAGDVPVATDMKHLTKVLEGVPRGI